MLVSPDRLVLSVLSWPVDFHHLQIIPKNFIPMVLGRPGERGPLTSSRNMRNIHRCYRLQHPRFTNLNVAVAAFLKESHQEGLYRLASVHTALCAYLQPAEKLSAVSTLRQCMP